MDKSIPFHCKNHMCIFLMESKILFIKFPRTHNSESLWEYVYIQRSILLLITKELYSPVSRRKFTHKMMSDEILFTLGWRLNRFINKHISYTAVKGTKFSFQWYKDLYIEWFLSKLWSEEEFTCGRKRQKSGVLHRKVGQITNETWVSKIIGGCCECLTAVLFRYSNR